LTVFDVAELSATGQAAYVYLRISFHAHPA